MINKSIWVVNSSPIITLAKIGRLDLLISQNLKILVPEAVADEIASGPPDDPARLAISRDGKIRP